MIELQTILFHQQTVNLSRDGYNNIWRNFTINDIIKKNVFKHQDFFLPAAKN